MDKWGYVVRFLNIYNKFFYYDVKYALFFGRNEAMILAFMKAFNVTIDKDKTQKDIEKILNELEDIVNDYILFFKSMGDTCDDIILNKYTPNLIREIITEINDIWDEFIASYNKTTTEFQAMLHKNMLIELNNFFSHLIKYNGNDKNLERAISHLYRGSVDGYKEIIHYNKLIAINSETIKNKIFEVRQKEAGFVGQKKINNKLDIINDYKIIVDDILTIKKISQN